MLRSPEVPDGSGRDAYWAVPADALLEALETSTTGLASSEAGARLRRLGPNRLRPAQHASALTAFARQFRSPLVLILIFAAVVSASLICCGRNSSITVSSAASASASSCRPPCS